VPQLKRLLETDQSYVKKDEKEFCCEIDAKLGFGTHGHVKLKVSSFSES